MLLWAHPKRRLDRFSRFYTVEFSERSSIGAFEISTLCLLEPPLLNIQFYPLHGGSDLWSGCDKKG